MHLASNIALFADGATALGHIAVRSGKSCTIWNRIGPQSWRKPPASRQPWFFGRFSQPARGLACLRARGPYGKNRPPAAAVSGRFS